MRVRALSDSTVQPWALAAGANLGHRARELRAVHAAAVAGERKDGVRGARAVVARSWSRMLAAGVDPGRRSDRTRYAAGEVGERRERSALKAIYDELVQVAASVSAASPALMVITDADGVVLWRHGSVAVRRQADALGFIEGALWTEASVGTNAIGTALVESAPVQLFSAEHFDPAQHPWYCTAYPVHDPRTGELLGIVDVSGPALSLQPVIATLVETTAALAESQLWRHHQRNLARLRLQSQPLLAAVRGPLLLVDDDGWVAHRDGVDSADRIAVPRPDKPVAVPGLGLCVPERLNDGWLLRVTGSSHLMRVVLKPGPNPVLHVHGSGTPWRAPLTTRHAQVLQAVAAAGPAGLTASDLSRKLFGDVEHVVAVRAEVSRLRRKVGSLITTAPYRIADGVTFTCESP